MAQELVPQRTATVSALMMGFAWGVGSLAPRAFEPLTPFIGGYHGAIIGLALGTTLSTILVLWLPRETRRPLLRLSWRLPHRFTPTQPDSSLAP
jgi:FSR family fosmidomycin resistance protein-like MFS transporter